VAKSVSLKPSDMLSEPQPLNINDKKTMSVLHEKPLEWLVNNFIPPPANPDSYFDLRGAPSVWCECSKKVSRSHLCLHAFCLASADDKLRELSDLRKIAFDQCSRIGDERSLFWLRNRPAFYINGLSVERKARVNCWSWEVKSKVSSLADQFGITMRSLLLVYSTKSLLSSDAELEGWRSILKQGIVDKWDARIADEIATIRRLFSLV
jgi:hypothetical protein